MAKSVTPSTDEAAAASPRAVMGKSGAAFTAPTTTQGTKVAKKNTQAGDPASGGKANRTNKAASHGAAHAITAKYTKQTDPAAGATLANGRLFASVINRTQPNFDAGVDTSY